MGFVSTKTRRAQSVVRVATLGLVAALAALSLALVQPAGAPEAGAAAIFSVKSSAETGGLASWNNPADGVAVFDHSSPVVADIDGNGRQDVIVGGINGLLYVWEYVPGSGLQQKGGFPHSVGTYINSSPAVADLDGDGKLEIIVGAGRIWKPGDPPPDYSGVYAIRWNGTRMWFAKADSDIAEGVFGTPTVGDIDGDGVPDVVFGGWDMYIHAVDGRNGAEKAGWPIDMADTVWSSAALAPRPGRSDLAIVIGSDLGGGNPGGWGGCPQYNQWGMTRGIVSVLDAWGNRIRQPHCLTTPIWSSPAIADLDNNGQPDIIVGTNAYNENGQSVGSADLIYAWDLWSGNDTPGWPKPTPGTMARNFGSPAVADMNGDGQVEVAIGNIYYGCVGQPQWNCGNLTLFNRSGGTVWYKNAEPSNNTFMGSPVMGDVNGDNRPEVIIAGGDWKVKAYDYAGNKVASFQGSLWFRNSPAFADVDNDGVPEVIAAGGTDWNSWRGKVWVLSTDGDPASVPGPWPLFRRDTLRQGNLFNPPGLMAPVFNFTATAGNTQVRLDWANPTSPSYASTRVLRKTGSYPSGPSDGTVLIDSNATTFTDTGLANSTKYYYAAFAHDGAGQFASATQASATPAGPPGPPTGVSSRAEDEQVNLFWSNPSHINFAGVRVVRKAGAAPPANPSDGTAVYDGPLTSYTDTGLTNGQQYSYALFAHDSWPQYSAAANTSATPATHSGPPYDAYLAEGYTGNGGFNSIDYLTLGNTDAGATAQVVATFYFESGTPIQKSYSIPALSRLTVVADSVVGENKAVGARFAVKSGPGVIVERPMYFAGNPGAGDVDGGHAAPASPKPMDNWYFAEGYTGGGWLEYLTALNSSAEGTSSVRATFTFPSGAPVIKNFAVSPQTRKTLNVNNEVGGDKEVSVKLEVTAGPPVVAERAMYFRADPALGAFITGGHAYPGTAQPEMDWYFAEGYTGGGFVEWLTLQNPDPAVDSVVDIEYVFASGAPTTRTYTVAKASRKTLNINADVGGGREVSIHVKVRAGKPALVAERPMYFSANPALGAWTDGGHNVLGATGPGADWYFAEGYTGSGFVEWLTLQNPDPAGDSSITITYVFSSGAPLVRNYVVPHASRKTLNVNAEAGPGREVSVHVHVNSGPGLIAERPMYFAADPALGRVVTDGHDVVGFRP